MAWFLLAACVGAKAPALPSDLDPGDEVVLRVGFTQVFGAWLLDEPSRGVTLALSVGDNDPRHLVLPGGWGGVAEVSLGPWDGGLVDVQILSGVASLSVEVVGGEASDAVPVFESEAPWLITAERDQRLQSMGPGGSKDPEGTLARRGAPIQLSERWDPAHEEWIGDDGSRTPFAGPFDGLHPIIEGSGLAWSPSTSPASPSAPLQAQLDDKPWALSLTWAELAREGGVLEAGGPGDGFAGMPWDYLFVDYEIQGQSDDRFAFRALVAGEWSDLTGVDLPEGVGRTALELPPGSMAEDVEGLELVRLVGSGNAALVGARWFAIGQDWRPQDLGAWSGVARFEGDAQDLLRVF